MSFELVNMLSKDILKVLYEYREKIKQYIIIENNKSCIQEENYT